MERGPPSMDGKSQPLLEALGGVRVGEGAFAQRVGSCVAEPEGVAELKDERDLRGEAFTPADEDGRVA